MARSKSETSVKSMAERLTLEMGFEVTAGMIRQWTKKKYDLHDMTKLKRSLRNQERVPKGLKPDPKPVTTKPEKESNKSKQLDLSRVEEELAGLHRKLVKAEDYETARTLRTQISGIRDVLKELREQGRYILKEEVKKAATIAGLASKNEWEKIEDALPPILEGCTALKMKAKLRDYARSVCLELQSLFNE